MRRRMGVALAEIRGHGPSNEYQKVTEHNPLLPLRRFRRFSRDPCDLR